MSGTLRGAQFLYLLFSICPPEYLHALTIPGQCGIGGLTGPPPSCPLIGAAPNAACLPFFAESAASSHILLRFFFLLLFVERQRQVPREEDVENQRL